LLLLLRRSFRSGDYHLSQPGSRLLVCHRVLLPLEKRLAQRADNFLCFGYFAQTLQDGQIIVVLNGVAQCFEANRRHNSVVADSPRRINQRAFTLKDDAFLALLRTATARVERRFCPGIIGLAPVRHPAPVEQTLYAVAPGHPGGHSVVEQREINVPPRRGRPLAERRVSPNRFAERLPLGSAVLAMQREQRAPDVHRAVEIAPRAVCTALARLGPRLLDDEHFDDRV